MKKEILLINPYNTLSVGGIKNTNRYLPIGLMYIASVLIKAGCTVKLKDIQNETLGIAEDKIDNYLNNNFKEYLKTLNPDFIGIGVIFPSRFKSALKISGIAKGVFKNVPVVLGGMHPTIFSKPVLKEHKCVDYVVLGEGEQSIVKLIKAHFKDKGLLREVDGIAYRKNNRVIVNPKRGYIKDLDEIPLPAYEIINIKDYYFDTSDWHNPKKLPINHNFSIITSRGCPRQCTYCAMKNFHGRTYRMRSAKNVVDEIEYLYHKYDCRYISFVDDNMTISKKRTLEIMSEICQRRLNIQFDASQGLEIRTIDKAILDAMVKAGFVRLTVGIESGSEYIRNKIIKKHLKDKTIYNFFKMVKEYEQLRFVGFFMCGFPQETKKTLADTFKMIKRIPFNDIGMCTMVPFYGTEMFEFCVENGLLKADIKNLHNMSDFSFYDVFFVKPFNLKTSYIANFRDKVLAYVKKREAMRQLKEAQHNPVILRKE